MTVLGDIYEPADPTTEAVTSVLTSSSRGSVVT